MTQASLPDRLEQANTDAIHRLGERASYQSSKALGGNAEEYEVLSQFESG